MLRRCIYKISHKENNIIQSLQTKLDTITSSMHGQAEIFYAGAYTLVQPDSCQKDCARLAHGLKVLASNVLIITSSRRHLPVSFPDFISHVAVEIFFFLLHAAFCVAFSVGYVYNLNNIKILMSASFVFIPNC